MQLDQIEEFFDSCGLKIYWTRIIFEEGFGGFISNFLPRSKLDQFNSICDWGDDIQQKANLMYPQILLQIGRDPVQNTRLSDFNRYHPSMGHNRSNGHPSSGEGRKFLEESGWPWWIF